MFFEVVITKILKMISTGFQLLIFSSKKKFKKKRKKIDKTNCEKHFILTCIEHNIRYSDLPKNLHNLIRTYTFINFWDFSFKTWFSPTWMRKNSFLQGLTKTYLHIYWFLRNLPPTWSNGPIWQVKVSKKIRYLRYACNPLCMRFGSERCRGVVRGGRHGTPRFWQIS